MIRVQKPPRTPAAVDQAWHVLADEERVAAEKFFAKPANRKKAFKKGKTSLFKAYGDKRLRAALNALFWNKCAYCESSYAPTQPVAIEHYRPKARVRDGGKYIRPGYYWLAADWDNLFPSCTDCNSGRQQEFEDGTKRVSGKGDEFPLAPNSPRATKPGEEAQEQPLLLNPGFDHPEKFLRFVHKSVKRKVKEFNAAGNATTSEIELPIVLAVPRDAKPPKPYPSAAESIRVYALNRLGLVEGRGQHASRLLLALEPLKDALVAFDANPNDPQLQARFLKAFDNVRNAYLLPRHAYYAMSRELALEFCPDLKRYL